MKIKIVHLLLKEEINSNRQISSIESISKLSKYDDIEYIQIWNELWTDEIPDGFFGNIEHVKKSYYGNYNSFKTSFIKEFTDNVDFFIQVEGDAILDYPSDRIYDKIKSSLLLIDERSVDILSFGSMFHLENGYQQSTTKLSFGDLNIVDKIIGAQFLIFSRKIRDYIISRYNEVGWTVADIFYNIILGSYNMAIYDRMYVSQADGNSMIDGYNKVHLKNLDYVEIGTSDFDTIVSDYPDYLKGISIDPVKCYIDKLPNIENNVKINMAISDKDGIMDVFYVNDQDIVENNIEEWVKGCSTIGKPHPNLKKYLNDNNLSHIYRNDKIEVKSFKSFIDENNIKSIDYLKIDTEGHDPFIIKSLLETDIRPNKITFEANSLLSENIILDTIFKLEEVGYTFLKRTQNDVCMTFDKKEEIIKKPILIFSTSKRLNYFKTTLKALLKNNPNISKDIETVYLLDHCSTIEDRNYMENSLDLIFNGNYKMVTFNITDRLSFIDKFNFIKKITKIDDIVFFMEDDWESSGNLRLNKHVNHLINSNYTQISFTDPFWVQNIDTKKETFLDFEYWKNPYPNTFIHPIKWNGDVCHWVTGRINNYTNNPSIIKAEVFHNNDFDYDKNFEFLFACKINGNHIFTHEEMFRHIGEVSLIDKL
jgi:FkbM family methyltransferase